MDKITRDSYIVVGIIAAVQLIISILWKYGVLEEGIVKGVIAGSLIAVSVLLPLILIPIYIKTSDQKLISSGTALTSGSFTAIFLNAFNLVVIKNVLRFYPCKGFCGSENILMGFLNLAYIGLGVILYYVGNSKLRKEEERKEYADF